MNKALLLFLLTIPCFAQTFSGNAGGDLFVPGPFRFCFGADDGKSTCFTRSGNNEVKTVGALDYQLAQRTVAKLPNATLNAGRIYLVTDGISSSDCTVGLGAIPVFCASNGSAWMGLANLGGGGGGGGGSVGSFSPGCIVSGAPAGSAVPLVCSSLIDNGATVRTNEAILAPVITGSTANGGIDMTTGTGAAIQPLSGHSDLFADSTQNGSIHAIVNGVDTNSFMGLNPTGTTYHVDGVTFTSLCDTVQNQIPNGTVAVVYEDIFETNIPCNPFQQGTRSVKVILGAYNSAYTFNVPLTIPTGNQLTGQGRGLGGGPFLGAGSAIAPSASYVSGYISSNPSGFTIAAGSSGCSYTAGTYMAGVTWSGDTTHETQMAQETPVTITGTAPNTTCFVFTPPVSPPAGVNFYNGYICSPAGCVSGSERYIFQSAIGTTTTWTGSISVGGSAGNPPGYNNTGSFVTLGDSIPPSGQANFGARIERLSIQCVNTANFTPISILSGEEGSGIFDVDIFNGPSCASQAGIIWEGYGGIGTGGSNSRIRDITINGGSYSVAAVVMDKVGFTRGLDGFTIVPTTGTTTTGILEIGPSLPPASGMRIANGHIEKTTTAGIALQNARGDIDNISFSPNVPTGITLDATSSPSAIHRVSGAGTNILVDSSVTPAFSDTRVQEAAYINGLSYQPLLIVGSAPTCTMTGLGTGGTPGCTPQTGSNNTVGVLNISTGTTALTASASGVLTLVFAGSSFGLNNSSCQYTLLNVMGSGTWNPRASMIGTQIGTGQQQTNWDNNAVALSNSQNYSIQYHCGPF